MFQTFLVTPLYNVYIFLIGITGGDAGLAIILLTLFIRIVFYPAFTASIRTQMGMQLVQKDLDEINKTYKDNSEERARRTMKLFKDKDIKPLSGFLALFIQIPVFIALYFAFFHEGLEHVNTDILYSFVQVPGQINTVFLGFIDLLTNGGIVLAVVVAATQYAAIRLSLLRGKAAAASLPPEKVLAQKMQNSLMLYGMPALLASITITLPGAVGIYFIAGNIISLGQEWIIKKQLTKKQEG